MSIVTGENIQKLYQMYRNDQFVINRNYQRKLVWTLEEKQYLIDSILKDFPIPLILLAENLDGKFEVIDGMQRLNAIFSFIENKFLYNDKCFDLNELTLAKQKQEEGLFDKAENSIERITREQCSNFLNYQLPVTKFKEEKENKTIDIFGRINSKGKQLSPQEKRQAGETGLFSKFVRKLSSEIRGDSSEEILNLSQMPEISIETNKKGNGYRILAEDTFWCKHGILKNDDLRNALDEEVIADLTASIALGFPLNTSSEVLDDLYSGETEKAKIIESNLVTNKEQIFKNMKSIFSIIDTIIADFSKTPKAFRDIIYGRKQSNPCKTPFIKFYLAMYDLIVNEKKTPTKYKNLIESLDKVNDKFCTTTGHYQKTEDRKTDIKVIKGLINEFFIDKEPSILNSGESLRKDLENYLMRSSIETTRFECKQGILNINEKSEDPDILDKIVKTLTSIANIKVTDGHSGYLFIGLGGK